MTNKQKKWALAAALAPVLALGLWLPFGAHRGADDPPALEVTPALRQELEALAADENALLNCLVSEPQIAQAARQGQAAALRCDEGRALTLGGCAQPVTVERFLLLFSDELRCAVVYAGGQQYVFALSDALAQQLRGCVAGM